MLDLTGLILTFNEKENIGRTLEALRWVPQIIVLDSHSTDGTPEIVSSYNNVQLERRAFDTFAGQCNYGLSLIKTRWVLSFDADYVCSTELAQEIAAAVADTEFVGFAASFRYCVFGRPLRSTLYPDRVILYRRELATYHNEGHGHRVRVNGRVRWLQSKVDHDDRKSLSRWIVSQTAYARVEAHYLFAASPRELNIQDRLRLRIFYAPPAMFCYLLFGRGLILDGWHGWFYVMQRVIAECVLSLRLLAERHGLEKQQTIGNSP